MFFGNYVFLMKLKPVILTPDAYSEMKVLDSCKATEKKDGSGKSVMLLENGDLTVSRMVKIEYVL